MEHAVQFEPVSPWRTTAIVATGVAALELVALIVAGTVLLGRSVVSHGGSVAAKPVASRPVTAKRPRAPSLPRVKTRIVVLNGNGEAGAAATEASTLRARGYKISSVGNAEHPTAGPTLVMYRPGFAPEAQRLARDFRIGVVTALDGVQPGSLHGAQLVVVLGTS